MGAELPERRRTPRSPLPALRLGRPVAEAVLHELIEVARLKDVGHRRQDVPDLVGEFLHQPVLVRVLLAQDIDAVLLHERIQLAELLPPMNGVERPREGRTARQKLPAAIVRLGAMR